MVKILSALAILSLSASVSLGHGHGLEKPVKRAVACSTAYKPIAAGSYPALDCVPFVQDPQVQTWLKLVDFTKTPVYPPSNNGACPADLTTIPKDQCWWTCQKCEAQGDITSCPKAGTWGLTYDDGPSPDSPRLYDYLLAHKQKATLFVVGSRAISNPATLKRAYNEGHQIAIHTWSHPSMTSLSNEQIVAELKWTEKAIFDQIGVTPLYWRPPFGDVDNRVRNIATQLGYKTAIWTQGFDTDDWNIPGGTATAQTVIANFNAFLAKVPTMTTGFIVLEHDLFPQEVNVSISGILPVAYQTKGLTIQPIAQCLGDGKPYKEGAGTFQLGSTTSNTTGGSNSNTPTAGGSSSASSSGGKTGGSASVIVPASSIMTGAGLVISAVVALF